MYHSHSLIFTIFFFVVFLIIVVIKLLKDKKAKETFFYPPELSKEGTGLVSSTAVEKHHATECPYGRVDILEDYKLLQHGVQKLELGYQNLSPNDTIMTTIPATSTKPPGDSLTQVEWITVFTTKLRVLDLPGFPNPVPQPAQLNCVIKKTDKMGSGMFATRDIKLGELILAERPLLSVALTPDVFGIDPCVHAMEWTPSIVAEVQNKLEIVIEGRMREEDRKALKALHTQNGGGSSAILDLINTNGFGIQLQTEDFLISQERYAIIGKDSSRINHSCVPNAECGFSLSSFSLQFTALKDIKAGEQFFISYLSSATSAQNRQESLARHYGIVCECFACANATPESDRLRLEGAQHIRYLDNLSDEWVKHPGDCLSEQVLEPVLQLKEAIEKECLDTEPEFAVLLVVFYKVYTRMGLTAKAEQYKAKLDRIGEGISRMEGHDGSVYRRRMFDACKARMAAISLGPE